jgi:tRNA-Thr(GGU) m(6)t(6)A37 methyltransferase TsaA
MDIHLKPIGVIRTRFHQPKDTPIQPSMAGGARSTVEVFEPYRQGLKDLEGFDRIWLIYWFHRASEPKLLVTPFLDNQQRGLFATRAPTRPNPIGISSVRLLRVEGKILTVADVDILDGTPLLDIKPYVPQFDCYAVKKCGWVDRAPVQSKTGDDRFHKNTRQKR